MDDKPPDKIYLIPDYEYGYTWCEDPAPGWGMDKKDSIEYVRADRLAEVERERDELDLYIKSLPAENLRDKYIELKEIVRWWAECRDLLLSGFTTKLGRNGWLESYFIMVKAEAALREAVEGE